ncbi:MAG: hemolysin family protein [Planctomycetota bacterium]
MIAFAPTELASALPGGWDTLSIALACLMPLLLLASALFSGTETACFGLTGAERLEVIRRDSVAARAARVLLSDQRMLLITLMLGNMTVNALYFVVSSVLMMTTSPGVIGSIAMALGTLVAILLLGEVLPKMLATSHRIGVVLFVSPPLAFVHRAIAPLRILVARAIVEPLGRLTAPREAPPSLNEAELGALLAISSRDGVIDLEEQRLIREVLALHRQRVRDVMTPRVEMEALPRGSSRAEVIEMVARTRLTRLPIYDGDLDHIVGLLHVKRFLLAPDDTPVDAPDIMTRPLFVPEMATADRLLENMREAHAQSAVVVDEFGGTAGVVAIRDVVEELVGEITGQDEIAIDPPRMIGLGRWRVSGAISVHDWAEAFGQSLDAPRVSTVGGLVLHILGRAPAVGDVVEFGSVRIEVESLKGLRVDTVLLTLEGMGGEVGPDEGDEGTEVPA